MAYSAFYTWAYSALYTNPAICVRCSYLNFCSDSQISHIWNFFIGLNTRIKLGKDNDI